MNSACSRWRSSSVRICIGIVDRKLDIGAIVAAAHLMSACCSF